MSLKNAVYYILGLLFIAAAIIWAITLNEICIGDLLLSLAGLPTHSQGNHGIHYTPFYSWFFLLPALSILNFPHPTIISRILWVTALVLALFLLIAPLGFII